MREATLEQKIAIDSVGKTIVSASAGSGKTFVMIQKLIKYLLSGGDLDKILCVTFTKKAAAQMREKLLSGIIAGIENANQEEKARLKNQLSKISTADISTIHSYLSKLLRTYYYILDLDASFELISSDDAEAMRLQERAMDSVFDRLYEEKDEDFLHLLDRFTKKRSDRALRELVLGGYRSVRSIANYDKLLERWSAADERETFDNVKAAYNDLAAKKFKRLLNYVQKFEDDFLKIADNEKYTQVFEAVKANLKICIDRGIFHGVKTLFTIPKPKKVKGEDDSVGGLYTDFRDEVKKRFEQITSDLLDEEKERWIFEESSKTSKAFTRLVLAFDREYMSVKTEENKLDYNDLEHLGLKLLESDKVLSEVRAKYERLFVDEYQDVNPIQEELISKIGGDVFLVGDVKQAIYGFRGSKSAFFKDKFLEFQTDDKQALELNRNFRSTDAVLEFVNKIFYKIITPEFYGLTYTPMYGGGNYPKDGAIAEVCSYDGTEEKAEVDEVYSVKKDAGRISHTKEGLAVLALVQEELQGRHFDLESGEFVQTKPSDICVLVRKNNDATKAIIKTLCDAGYSVSSAGNTNICDTPEVANMLDILSYLDNSSQDIPLVAALMSPLGGLNEEELAKIKIFSQRTKTTLKNGRERYLNYGECCSRYMANIPDDITIKLKAFFAEAKRLKGLLALLSCDKIIDEILAVGGFEAELSTGGGDKLRNVLTLAESARGMTVSQFLYRLRQSGNQIRSAQAANSESIKVLTMHSSKGLEFPVVILSDISKTFEGDNKTVIRFDDEFGFATRYFNIEGKYTSDTLLRRYERAKQKDDDLLNEVNLFYVACTRAMCNLHVLTSRLPKYSPYIDDSRTYADMFDVESFSPRTLTLPDEFGVSAAKRDITAEFDDSIKAAIESRFMQEYPFADSISLPVKSSATALLKSDDEPHYYEKQLFSGEGETNTDIGTAYHRFLELHDFAVDEAGIAGEIAGFVQSGEMQQAEAALLDKEQIKKILSMSAFSNIAGKQLLREQEFLCRLKASDIMDTAAEDFVLLQGAIDLLVIDGEQIHIVDYKYSSHDDEYLIRTYKKQLEIYKMAVATIMGEEREISLTLLNIFKCRQIDL